MTSKPSAGVRRGPFKFTLVRQRPLCRSKTANDSQVGFLIDGLLSDAGLTPVRSSHTRLRFSEPSAEAQSSALLRGAIRASASRDPRAGVEVHALGLRPG
jgi:hypothetical protein